MSRVDKTRERVLLGNADANIDFNELRKLLDDLGFIERIKSSHHIFVRSGVEEIINYNRKEVRLRPIR